MFRSLARVASVCVAFAFLQGCTSVHVARPVGDVPVTLDPAEWNGTWCDTKGLVPVPGTLMLSAEGTDCVTVTVVDANLGVVDVVAGDDADDCWRAHLRRREGDGDRVLVSVEKDGAFTFELRAVREGDELVAWAVSGEAIANEIRSGGLRGSVDGQGEVRLDAESPATAERLSQDRGDLFDWTHPLVLVRVTGS